MHKVSNKTVLKNLELFIRVLELLLTHREKFVKSIESRVYDAFVDALTGDIHFAALEKNLKVLETPNRVFLQIQMQLLSEGGDHLQFDFISEENMKALHPQALRIVKETLKTLNQIALEHKELSSFDDFFETLKMDVGIEPQDIIHEAWHQVDRWGAENLLLDHPKGTFLFRKDPYAAVLEESLSLELKKSVKCVTLTYLASSNKVVDRTIVKTAEGWLFYDDDPSLEGHCYLSAKQLLATLKAELKFPLISY